MTPETVISVAREALTITAMVAAPPLLAALITGVLVGVLQAATQINEMTLSFIPKLIALAVTLLATGPWMIELLTSYTRSLFHNIPAMLG
jgi:flagellar biosynthetic protein FliQ